MTLFWLDGRAAVHGSDSVWGTGIGSAGPAQPRDRGNRCQVGDSPRWQKMAARLEDGADAVAAPGGPPATPPVTRSSEAPWLLLRYGASGGAGDSHERQPGAPAPVASSRQLVRSAASWPNAAGR